MGVVPVVPPEPIPLPIPTVGLVYRRRIELDVHDDGVDAEMEDTHHHFRITIRHDGTMVTSTSAEGRRVPWATCREGAAGIALLEGRLLAEVVASASWASDRSQTCVHGVDLAVLALAHASTPGHVHYEVRLHDPGAARRRLVVRRDGAEVLAWDIDGDVIVGPEPFTGQGLRGPGLQAWARQALPPAVVEAVGIARRCAHVGRSRAMDLDDYPTAGHVMVPDRSCRTYQPEHAAVAFRQVGSSRATEQYPDA